MVRRATRPSINDLSAIAHAVAQAADRKTALDNLVAELSLVLDARVCILQQIDHAWTIVAQPPDGLDLRVPDRQLAVLGSNGHASGGIDLVNTDDGAWTSVLVEDPQGAPLIILLAGDWTLLERVVLNPLALLLSFALTSISEREARRTTERWLVDGFALARRLSRHGDQELVAQRLVDQVSRSLKADRVALALHNPDDDRLAVVATHGYPLALVQDIRIEPGAWVIGHVFSRGRPIVAPDVRQVNGMAAEDRQYRTFSFAAAPIVAGGETIGVLTATDKHDGAAFDHRDAMALRMLGASAALALIGARKDAEMHRLTYAATFDSLTELFNRPYFDTRFHQEVERARRHASSLTLLIADIDDFKVINDTYGHQIGDAVLQTVGAVLRSAVRVFDVCARYGGDEFAILMPSSDQSSAAACAERIRQRVSEWEHTDDSVSRLPRATLSIGVAVLSSAEAAGDLIGRADQSLYRAKASGKNRVCVHGATGRDRESSLAGREPGEPA